jgi:hypothetical protein
MRIGAGQFGATRVQAALKLTHVRAKTRDRRFES